MQFPYSKTIKIEPFNYLFTCDLCLGFWVYFSMLGLLKLDGGLFSYVPLLSEVITASLFTIVSHYVGLGWKLKHGVFE